MLSSKHIGMNFSKGVTWRWVESLAHVKNCRNVISQRCNKQHIDHGQLASQAEISQLCVMTWHNSDWWFSCVFAASCQGWYLTHNCDLLKSGAACKVTNINKQWENIEIPDYPLFSLLTFDKHYRPFNWKLFAGNANNDLWNGTSKKAILFNKQSKKCPLMFVEIPSKQTSSLMEAFSDALDCTSKGIIPTKHDWTIKLLLILLSYWYIFAYFLPFFQDPVIQVSLRQPLKTRAFSSQAQ